MYYYSPDTNRKGKIAALAAIGLYVLVLVLLLVFGKITMERVAHDEGILIDFGNTTEGEGDERVAFADELAQSANSAQAADAARLTQDFEDAPAIADSRNDRTDATRQSDQPADASQTAEVRPREVDSRALFPGRSAESGAESQGSQAGPGNAGHESGADGGRTDGTGTGDSGISFSLEGRQPVDSFPTPVYPARNQQGMVVIRITVDSAGSVITAEHEPLGSTTTDEEFVRAALNAARKARFSPDDNNPVQTGTITYIFSLTR